MRDEFLCIKWYVSDVLDLARDELIPLTFDEARYILEGIIDSHDPSDGVTWDTIRCAIYAYEEDESDV